MAPVILVVDDHPETCILIVCILRRQGYEVAAVAEGEAALAVVATQRPDLVIADVFLPRLDGLTLIDTLRRDNPLLPVIAISGVTDVLERRNWCLLVWTRGPSRSWRSPLAYRPSAPWCTSGCPSLS